MNNLPKEVKNNFFDKIKLFFYKLSQKNKSNKNPENVQTNKLEIKDNEKSNFIENLQKDVIATNNRNYVLQQIQENPRILNSLSLDKLEIIEKLYDAEIFKNDKEIKMLNHKIEKLQNSINS